MLALGALWLALLWLALLWSTQLRVTLLKVASPPLWQAQQWVEQPLAPPERVLPQVQDAWESALKK